MVGSSKSDWVHWSKKMFLNHEIDPDHYSAVKGIHDSRDLFQQFKFNIFQSISGTLLSHQISRWYG